MRPELIVNCRCETGEGVLWHPDEQCLYWLDIPRGRLYRLEPASGRTDEFDLGAATGAFTIHEDGRLLLFMADGAVKLWAAPDRFETVIAAIPDEVGNRFNDVIADPEGRVYCGVMSTPERAGRLYRLDPDRSLHVMLECTGTANGMGFSPDLRQLYFCDSRQCTISVFDYERMTGVLRNRRILLDTSGMPEKGRPDGMTVDIEGCIWSARWAGAAVYRLSPTGEELVRIGFPTTNVSCVTFGGRDYSVLYVTTAVGSVPACFEAAAGALFAVRAGVRGRPEFRSRLAAVRR